MTIILIVAEGNNGEIGANNRLLWHMSNDMKFFKRVTTGNTVIMGRKTFESLPYALPDRQNIVISRNPEYIADGAEVVQNCQMALSRAKYERVFVIGGESIYKQFMECANFILCTIVDQDYPDADAFFPEIKTDNSLEKGDWNYTCLESGVDHGYLYKRLLYTRKEVK